MQHDDEIINLACLQLISSIEDKLSSRVPLYAELIEKIGSSKIDDFEAFRERLNHDTIDVVRRITKICIRDGIDLFKYKESLYVARKFDLDKIIDLAISSAYFNEVIIRPLEMTIVGRVMEL